MVMYFSGMNIGQKIKDLRIKRGWTQKDLAGRLETTQKVISDYENQYSNPPIERLPDIAHAFGISVDELLGVKPIREVKEISRTHGNSRLSRIQEMYSQLTPADQRAILKQIRGLLLQTNSLRASDGDSSKES